MFITTYNRSSPNFDDLFTRFWPYLTRFTKIRDLVNKEIIVTNRNHHPLSDMFVVKNFLNPKQNPKNYATDQILVNTYAENQERTIVDHHNRT